MKIKKAIFGSLGIISVGIIPTIITTACTAQNDFTITKGENITKDEISFLVTKAETISDAIIAKMNAILAFPKNKTNLEKIAKSNILFLDSGATDINSISKLDSDGNIRTPEFYPILYSDQKNGDFPGFGFNFPTPNKSLSENSSPNLAYLNGVGYAESSGAENINTYEAFKGTADYIFYLTEPVYDWAFDFTTSKTNSVQGEGKGTQIDTATVKEDAKKKVLENEKLNSLLDKSESVINIENVDKITLANRQIFYNSIWGGPIGINTFIDNIAKIFHLIIPTQADFNDLNDEDKNTTYQPLHKTISEVISGYLNLSNNLNFSKIVNKTLNIQDDKAFLAAYSPVIDMSLALGFNPNFTSQYVKKSSDSNLLRYQVSWPMFLNGIANKDLIKSTSLVIDKSNSNTLTRYNLKTIGIEWWQNEDVKDLNLELAKTGMGGNTQTVTPGLFESTEYKNSDNAKPYGWNYADSSLKLNELATYKADYKSNEKYQVKSYSKDGKEVNQITWKWLYNPYNAFVSYASYIKQIYFELV